MLQGVLFNICGNHSETEAASMQNLIQILKSSGIKIVYSADFAVENKTPAASGEFPLIGLSPKECLVITDSEQGCVFAKSAGIPCLGYLNPCMTPGISDSAPETLSCAYALFESFSSIDRDYLYRTHAHAVGYPADILTTGRLLIRELSLEDFPSLYAMCTAPSTACYMEEVLSDYETEQKKHMAYLQNIYPLFDLAFWGVYEKNTGKLIGRAGFSLPSDNSDTFSLGYLIDVPYRGRGYAKECIPALLIFAKEQGYTLVSARVKEENLLSIKVLEQCGFPYAYSTDTAAGVRIYTIQLAE